MKKILVLLVLLTTTVAFSNVDVQSSTVQTKKKALVVSWQNDYGYWYAVGPTQRTSVGCKTEEEAIGLAGGGKKDDLEFKETIGKYRIYALDRNLEGYEVDARIFLKNNDIVLSY